MVVVVVVVSSIGEKVEGVVSGASSLANKWSDLLLAFAPAPFAREEHSTAEARLTQALLPFWD